jgi:phage terminase Nu1 subunit (DNA packaging protein)
MSGRIQSAAAADILGLSRRSVQEFALRGQLPSSARIGGVWTFDADRLVAFVKQRERDAEAKQATNVCRPISVRLPTQARTNAAYERLKAQRYSRPAAH